MLTYVCIVQTMCSNVASSFSMGDMFADTYGWLYAIVSSRRHLSDVLYAMEENENNEEEDTAVLPVGDVQ